MHNLGIKDKISFIGLRLNHRFLPGVRGDGLEVPRMSQTYCIINCFVFVSRHLDILGVLLYYLRILRVRQAKKIENYWSRS